MSSNSTVVVTGASGLLGRAVMARLKESGAWKKVVGTAFSRSGLEKEHFKKRLVFMWTIIFFERSRGTSKSARQRVSTIESAHNTATLYCAKPH